MSSFNVSLVHIVGPWIQLFFALGLLLMVGAILVAISFWGERSLIRTKKRFFWAFPFPTLFVCLLYGGLRFSGLLLYSKDGWDTSGIWNYTNQNEGMLIIFLCVCLLIGATLAVRKEKRKAGL